MNSEIQKLHNEKVMLKEQLGWTYPQQYKYGDYNNNYDDILINTFVIRQYQMFEEAKNRDQAIGEPPKGVPINQFLLEERTNIIREILVLVSINTKEEYNNNIYLYNNIDNNIIL